MSETKTELVETTALENIDAYLDGEELSEEEARKLEQWIKTDSENADQAFRRVFLHSLSAGTFSGSFDWRSTGT